MRSDRPLIWGATAVNLRGVMPVGRLSIGAGLFILGGFGLLAVAATAHATRVPWLPWAAPGGSALGGVGVGLSIALWNYIGWDNPSTVEGEIVDASRTYPRALCFALPLVSLGYLIPLLAALSASDWTGWREGGWPDIAQACAGALGRPIALLLALGGMASALALFLEFSSLIALRAREPSLRGPFRIRAGLPGVAALAAIPMVVLCGVTLLTLHDAEYGRPAILVSLIAAVLGAPAYWLADRARRRKASVKGSAPDVTSQA